MLEQDAKPGSVASLLLENSQRLMDGIGAVSRIKHRLPHRLQRTRSRLPHCLCFPAIPASENTYRIKEPQDVCTFCYYATLQVCGNKTWQHVCSAYPRNWKCQARLHLQRCARPTLNSAHTRQALVCPVQKSGRKFEFTV